MTRYSAIPTTYKGIKFRSRLEAKWARMFDALDWKWEYEPFDLNGWIPDFVFPARHRKVQTFTKDCNLIWKEIKGSQVAVEVKPVSGEDDPLFIQTTKEIEKSGWDHDALIVSYFLPEINDEPGLGWLGEYYEENNDSFWWEEAPFQETNIASIPIGFCHSMGSYCDRVTGHCPGGSYGLPVPLQNVVKHFWNESTNDVQWIRK